MLFAAFSTVCALAPTVEVLIAARVGQGIGGCRARQTALLRCVTQAT
ncbi:hypothetical protein [Streptomyces nigrescens]